MQIVKEILKFIESYEDLKEVNPEIDQFCKVSGYENFFIHREGVAFCYGCVESNLISLDYSGLDCLVNSSEYADSILCECCGKELSPYIEEDKEI